MFIDIYMCLVDEKFLYFCFRGEKEEEGVSPQLLKSSPDTKKPFSLDPENLTKSHLPLSTRQREAQITLLTLKKKTVIGFSMGLSLTLPLIINVNRL